MRGPALILGAALAFAPAIAQEQLGPAIGVPQSAVVVLDRDALFSSSLFGQRISRDIEAASAALAAENRRIEEELEAEEQALTEQRDTMDMAAFRSLASDFDRRVTDIRERQDAKARAIAQQTERAQQIFLEQANPVLAQLAQETGALVILDRRSVIASADRIDITVLATRRIDAVLGDGGDLDASSTEDPAPGDGTPGGD
ncbi:OmpH family outer membrane protein [Jannaschia marina]|uniref:OmpH family outer membrane protein n=1 Tax=Jannaschia marina TaxID=2741674 RepID=UPI0015CCC0DB|nr:OmpH family outer membrane protein [Jannaschia marina]